MKKNKCKFGRIVSSFLDKDSRMIHLPLNAIKHIAKNHPSLSMDWKPIKDVVQNYDEYEIQKGDKYPSLYFKETGQKNNFGVKTRWKVVTNGCEINVGQGSSRKTNHVVTVYQVVMKQKA
jgi:hypothetical protein